MVDIHPALVHEAQDEEGLSNVIGVKMWTQFRADFNRNSKTLKSKKKGAQDTTVEILLGKIRAWSELLRSVLNDDAYFSPTESVHLAAGSVRGIWWTSAGIISTPVCHIHC